MRPARLGEEVARGVRAGNGAGHGVAPTPAELVRDQTLSMPWPAIESVRGSLPMTMLAPALPPKASLKAVPPMTRTGEKEWNAVDEGASLNVRQRP